MSLLHAMRDLPGISTSDDADSRQSDWTRSVYQDPPAEAMSVTRQQKPSFGGRYAVMGSIADVLMASRSRTASQQHLVEPPKEQHWSKSHTITVQGSEMQILVIGAMTEPAQRRNYVAGWLKAVGPASDLEMLADMLHKLFRSANDEVFEDGMDSHFSNSLNRIIRTHGIAVVSALERIMCMDDVNPEVAAEALTWVGRMDDKQTHRARLSLLERALESPNVCIRDGASIGIGAMDDPAAIGSLRKAIDRERCGLLRQNLKSTLEQLKDAR